MLRRATLLVAPLLSTALLVGVTPAFAQEPTPPSAAGVGQEPVEGQGPTTPGPLYDETAGAVEPAAEPVADGTVQVRVVAGRWTRAGDLPVRVRGVQGSPGMVRVTFSTGSDVADRGGAAAVLVERVDGSDVPAPVRVAVDTDALGGVFKANFVHRLRLATSRACVALLHPHEDQGNHKSRAYAYGKGKHCPTSDPVDVPITDDLGDGDLEFDAVAGADEEATEQAPEEATPDQTPEPSTAPSQDPQDAPEAGTGSETTTHAASETSPEEPTTTPTQATADSGSPEPKGDNGVRDHGAGEGRQGSPKASLRSGTSSGGTAYLLSAGPSGSAGSFAATPLFSCSPALWRMRLRRVSSATTTLRTAAPSPADRLVCRGQSDAHLNNQ